MDIDITALVADIFAAIKGKVTEGFNKIRTLTDAQVKRLARRAQLLARMKVAGEFSDDELEDELERARDLTKSIGMTVAALAAITLEKAWNAIVKVVWGAINGVLGAAGLGFLALPAAPNP